MSEDAPEQVISLEMADRVLRQGELYLQAQLQSAIAADQRATTMAAFFGTLGSAVVAASIAYWDTTSDLPTLIAGLAGAAFMVSGAGVCLWAARPVNFYFVGNHPQSWFDVLGRPLPEVLLGEAENYQDHIVSNTNLLEYNGTCLKWGAATAVVAPVFDFLFWALLSAIISPSYSEEKASDEIHLPLSSGESWQSSP